MKKYIYQDTNKTKNSGYIQPLVLLYCRVPQMTPLMQIEEHPRSGTS